jgi:hypothetical protein
MTDETWHWVADHLKARRLELTNGNSRRAAFLRQRDAMDFDRIAVDLEGAVRDNYDPGTIAKAEHIYRWKPGSIRAIRAGGEPSPIESDPNPTPTRRTA